MLAIAVTAWYGDLRPALPATILGTLAIGTIVRPPGRADVRAVDTLALLGAYLTAAALLATRAAAEAARPASERRYRALFEQASDPMLIGTDAGSILDANAQLCQVLGYAREELVRLQVADVFVTTPAQQAATRAALRRGERAG